MSLATLFDLKRDEIVHRFRDRIAKNDRTKLTREERDNLALLLVDRLVELNQQGNDTLEQIQTVCEAEKALLEEGYPQSSINSAYLPTYTRLLKDAIAGERLKLTGQNSFEKAWTKRDGSESGVSRVHFAFSFLTYDLATQSQLRGLTTAKNNERQDDLKPVRVYPYLGQVQELLNSDEPELLAIAIAALTGRRHAEVVAVGMFQETGHPYQLRFEGQLKKVESEAFEIVSLVPARELLPVFDRFRGLPGVQALVGLDDDDPLVQAFNSRVNRRVRSLFETTGLVPVLEGFKTVSIHRLRALYGAIAIHFFCANNQHLHRFLQNHLGHVLTKEVGASNSRATDHYFHYFLVDEEEKPLTARGVKLMAHGALKKLDEVKTKGAIKGDVVEPISQRKRKNDSLRIPSGTLDRWNQFLAARFPDRTGQADRMLALLEWVEDKINHEGTVDHVEDVEVAEPEPATSTELERVQAALAEMGQRLAVLEQRATTPRKPVIQATTESGEGGSTKSGGKAADRASKILTAIKEWNEKNPEKSFAVTLSLLKDDFGINFKAARGFLEAHEAEIAQLHQVSGVTNPRSHNRQKGRNIDELKAFESFGSNYKIGDAIRETRQRP